MLLNKIRDERGEKDSEREREREEGKYRQFRRCATKPTHWPRHVEELEWNKVKG